MSTLGNYMFQSFNFRQREKLRPFYALIANIATEELGHIELVGAAVNGLLNGMEPKGDMSKGEPSFAGMFSGAALKSHVAPGPHAGIMCADSLGNPWKGDYIFN